MTARAPYLRTPWLPGEAEKLRAAWPGNSLDEIALATGHSVQACQHKAWKLGLGRRGAPLPAVQAAPPAPAPDGKCRRSTPEGVEKLCPRCNDWWPDDRQFFNGQGSGRGLSSWCKACMLEAKAATRQARAAGHGAAQGAQA